ncbi:prepilin peptidase [Corynebacterium sp. Marseille-P4321]|uniref:prepilin peptidase n=1 Tax=Corynebacterium sp. Marseille-P4321 TaxID=2736603 RepID=UPI00158A858F|nr:prepilin peptidase [Corynebacterium sp. Marseille-P4321]
MGSGGIWVLCLGGATSLCWAVVLVYYDITSRRLPNPLTAPPALAAVVACVVWPSLSPGLVWPAAYLVSGRGIGGGDVKLAVPLGVACAAAGGYFAVLMAVALSGAFTLLFAALNRRKAIAHGPSMLAATAVVIAGFMT